MLRRHRRVMYRFNHCVIKDRFANNTTTQVHDFSATEARSNRNAPFERRGKGHSAWGISRIRDSPETETAQTIND